jgi:hypothetical protein
VPHLLQAVSVNIQTNITQPCVTDVCNHIYWQNLEDHV